MVRYKIGCNFLALIGDARTPCMFFTYTSEDPLFSRPILWYSLILASHKIRNKSYVQLALATVFTG